jgi:UDP-N-acetylmuramate: L-alanyl-gamma-D-glutamyl-meso-diaminopimelate ligase
LYNARNAATAATAVALALNAANPTDFKLDAIARFRGVKRRQEILWRGPELTVIEDFGHHPTAVAEILQSFRVRFPSARITAVFEPRSNTARTKALQTGFMRALAQADEVYLGAVSRAEKIGPEERFDPEAVAQQLDLQGVEAHIGPTNNAVLEKLKANTLSVGKGGPRLVIFFTNGSFDGIIEQYVEAARISR